MRRILFGAAVAVLLAAPALAQIVPAPAFTVEQLQERPTENWITNGGNLTNQRFSPLSQINSANVGSLKLAYSLQLGSLRTNESTPIVIGDTLYVSTSWGPKSVYALNAKDGTVDTYEYYAQPDLTLGGGLSRVVQNSRIVENTVVPTTDGMSITGQIIDTVNRSINQDNVEILESERVETYQACSWGTGMALVSAADDPSGRNRTTNYVYNDGVASTSPV